MLRSVAGALLLAVLTPAAALAQAGRRGDMLDVNTASERQLRAVPGLTSALVDAVVDRRPFLTIGALDEVLATALSGEQRGVVYRRLFVQVNLNTASDEETLLIPGLAAHVRGALRESRPYRTLAQFRREMTKHMDAREVARLEQYVFVPINLNTASDADILSIPGVGQRMLSEFKEYRPYRAIQQFRREIGKYVDQREVARLERYVTLD